MALVAGPMAGMVTVTAQAVDSPELVAVREDGVLKLEAGGVIQGRAYRIERSDTLGVGNWEGVGPSTYASNRDRFVLFYRDMWEWDGVRWTEIPVRAEEPAGGVTWFDSSRGRPVLFNAPNTWVYHR